MADLNKNMKAMHAKFGRIKVDLRKLLEDYDGLFREVNGTYMNERLASGTTAGLEDFYRLLQVLRRNRDVISSLVRGCEGLRPVDKFAFVEEDIPESKEPEKKNEKKSTAQEMQTILQDLEVITHA